MKFYHLNYKCMNCYFWMEIYIPVKIEAPLYVDCLNCGMNMSSKTDRKPKDDEYATEGTYDPNNMTVKVGRL